MRYRFINAIEVEKTTVRMCWLLSQMHHFISEKLPGRSLTSNKRRKEDGHRGYCVVGTMVTKKIVRLLSVIVFFVTYYGNLNI